MKLSKKEKLIKAATNFSPFDFSYALFIEQKALELMHEHFKSQKIAAGDDIVARDTKLAIKLLNIIFELDSAQYVNLRNVHRFNSRNPDLDYTIPSLRNSIRIEKAWYLYNKIRYERMRTWWN